MNYAEWIRTVPAEITGDTLWHHEVYRLALFAADLAWHDTGKLVQDRRAVQMAAQLLESVGSVGANIAEGYSRGSGKDRARFYEYSLGSARESRTWYFDSRHALGEAVARHRMILHTQMVRLLLTMLPATRGYSLHEGGESEPGQIDDRPPELVTAELQRTLEAVPMPDP